MKKQVPSESRNSPVSKRARRRGTQMQRGQILILVVFAVVGLVAFAGLVIDTGLVFIGYGALRRSVDAASLAAAAQYRRSPDPEGLAKAAVEFLTLNNVSDPSAEVKVCNPDFPAYHDEALCTVPVRRRLVKVNATSKVKLAFLPVIGIKSVSLHATATAEAASLDIVLLADVSESMTWDSAQNDLMKDPVECNNVLSGQPTNCQPFHDIQGAANSFVESLFPADGTNQYDRISVIPFDRTVHPDGAPYDAPLHLSDFAGLSGVDYRNKILNTIADMRVYTASDVQSTGSPFTDGSCLDVNGNLDYPSDGPCRYYPPNNSPYCFADDTGLIPSGHGPNSSR